MRHILSMAICVLTWHSLAMQTDGETISSPCRIEVIEQDSGRPVPLVELRTNHFVSFITDNAGVIAFNLPELMNREIWLYVTADGYEVPADGFGYRGMRVTPAPGKTIRIVVHRTSIASRVGRLTGGGLFAESQLLGADKHWSESGVLGCDSVQTVLHRGRQYWFWGDTTLSNYPLGIFHASGATTDAKPLATVEPPLRLEYHYFRDKQNQPRGVAKMAGDGPTWLTGCVSVPDQEGQSHLAATYLKVRGMLDIYECGLCAWNDESEQFDRLRVVWKRSDSVPNLPAILPQGHATLWKDNEAKEWILFGNPFPMLRCAATMADWQTPERWQSIDPQKELIDAATSEKINPHSGSIAWNAYRQRWVAVFMQHFGKPSAFGEVWYAEATNPMGPWGKAVKILSHANYTFYNPHIDSHLAPPDARFLLFEGTYSQQFAKPERVTPRYDYNQILYRLDLDDPRLASAQTP